MEKALSRTSMIYGEKAIERLKKSHVAIFGIGGVGGYVTEALARSGVGTFTLFDNDVVEESNINRQIIATTKTLNQPKVAIMKERILSINPKADVNDRMMFVKEDNLSEINFKEFDYIVDAIDSVKSKIAIISKANELNIPIISSMGTGNKVNPMGFIVTDINKTEMDPLAKVIRYELRKLGIKKLKVIYSKEKPIKTIGEEKVPGSNAFVPSAAGLLIASEVVRDLTNDVARSELKR